MKQRYIHHCRVVTLEQRSTAGLGLRVPSCACASGEKLNRVSEQLNCLDESTAGCKLWWLRSCFPAPLIKGAVGAAPSRKRAGLQLVLPGYLSSQTGQHSRAHTLTWDSHPCLSGASENKLCHLLRHQHVIFCSIYRGLFV